MGRRSRTPPPIQSRVLVPSGRAELPGTHYLGADPRIVQAHKGVVDAGTATGLADHLAPPPGSEHPLVQSIAGVAERCVEAQTFAGAETVERDGEELNAGECHGSCSCPRGGGRSTSSVTPHRPLGNRPA